MSSVNPDVWGEEGEGKHEAALLLMINLFIEPNRIKLSDINAAIVCEKLTLNFASEKKINFDLHSSPGLNY